MSKGWEFFWEGRLYCVGASDAPTARKHLRNLSKSSSSVSRIATV